MGKCVDTGAMTITPGNANSVGPHEGQLQGRDPLRDRGGIEQRLPRHLLDTLRTGTRQAELAGGIVGPMSLSTILGPLHPDSILLPDNPGGYDPASCRILHRILPLATRLC